MEVIGMEPGEVYEVRYGPTLKTTVMLIGCVVLTLGCLLPEVPLHIRVLGVLLFGVGSVVFLAMTFSRQVAFRVDAEGITVAGGPFRYRASLLSVPWTDVKAVVLWKQQAAQNIPYVGVLRHEDRPADKPVGKARRLLYGAVAGHVPAEVANASRQVNGWRLDRDRLAAAVAHFAPDVEIIDLG
ncbi:hypothetical protein [Actinomadura bangladeshensis]|uniref:Uncharacterized protein n=1 Tax=Actinomadura bangladeshensis TaxID=453573 RepID=A0A6L9QS62_9ACTN|nr:hypothetical protein [Actinomadura bangladeshensis]NEA28339.1 hypothetical protein [Actinomadura bangladeshensis]